MKQLFIILATVAGTLSASARDYAHATATETNVFLGQVFNLDVVVKAADKPATPNLRGLNGFNATLLDSGKPTNEPGTWFYRLAFRATTEGNLTIPALQFGDSQTQPVNITANKPQPTDRMTLDLKLSKSSVYQGEPLLLTATWDSTYPFGTIRAVDLHFPILNDQRFQVLELYDPNKEQKKETTGLPVHGTRVLATRRNHEQEGQLHQSLMFDKLLVPKKTGRITIQPATLLCAAEKDNPNAKNRRSAFQYPAYFDNTFFDQNLTGGNWSRIYTESAPLELEVKPLPAEGRPNLFNGMVGDYRITVQAEPLDVRVGDPITLTITITAAEHMENIFFQPLRYQPLLVNRFEIPSDRSLPQREDQSKIYTQTIRPLSTGNTEIPPIQLAYFSPTSNAYVTIQSEPIPLKVSPAEEVDVFGGSLYQSRLRTVEEGIRHNYEDPYMLLNQQPPLFGWAHPFAVAAILFIPPIVAGGFLLIALFGVKRHHIHRTAKAARAFSVFRKNVAHIVHGHAMKSEIYGDLDQILRAYLGDRLHLNPGALSFRDAELRLIEAGAENQTLEELKHLFARCEAYRFTTNYDEPGDAKQIVRGAVRIVKAVERTLK
jgi:hypothetical protein